MKITKRQKARAKYKARYGYEPRTESALDSFMSTLLQSDFSDCVDYGSGSTDSGSCVSTDYHGGYSGVDSYSSSYDSGSSYSDSGSSCGSD